MADIILRNDNKSIKLTAQQKNINLKHTSAPVSLLSGTNDYNDLINTPDLSNYTTKVYVDTSLAGKADTVHVHTMSSITGLQTALDAKANKVHTHVASDTTDFNTAVSNNSNVSANTAARHTHTNKAILDATSASFTTSDNTKLDGIEAGAQVNTVTSVAGKTGTVTLGKGDVGLSNVDNTSDANKPIATATQSALNAKADLVNGKVPEAQLPSFVDHVLSFNSQTNFPATGEDGKIYIAKDTNLTFRWTGSAYTEISPSLALGETASTAYRGDRGKTAYDHTFNTNNPHNVTKAQVGLSNVDNTSDANKPISTSTQAALDAKATTTELTSHTGNTSNPHSVTKAQVGLGNVDNTSDASKPVSTATQTALNAKANTSHTHAISDVTSLQAALDAKATTTNLTSHTSNTSNPHSVTKAQVGLGSVDNTSDANKPVSTATQTALDTKVAKGSLMFNVKDYGATGDGTTNDTTAIQNALDAAQTAGGGVVFFPVGTYSVTPVYAGAGVSILGAGNEKTIVKRRNQVANNPNSVGAINFHGTSTVPLHRFFVRDITADGNRGGITAGTGGLVDNEAFSFIYARNFTVDSCRGINAPGEGFDLDYCINGTIVNSIGSDNGGNGFHASLDSNRLKFIGNYAFGNALDFPRAGFDQWTTAGDCVYIGNIAESNNHRNYNIVGTGAVVVGNRSLGTTPQEDVFDGAIGSSVITAVKKLATSTKMRTITMAGWTYVSGNGNQLLQHTLTFPDTFDELVSITVSLAGSRQTTKGAPAEISDFDEPITGNYGPIGTHGLILGPTPSITTSLLRPAGQTWSTGWNYGYSWVAIVRKKQ